ncbi:unnamed protein product [Onchocerca flexuosa]|uniref:Fibrinogen C-terminal domain-containing protein n=1 Tax=Onchocerca flexuosa TaxID=387005 RepID=A0A183H215_9BILA|nr:unnamed protein product [Onchocerca flexuosa]
MNAEDFTNDKTFCREYKLPTDNIACSLHHPNGTRVGNVTYYSTAGRIKGKSRVLYKTRKNNSDYGPTYHTNNFKWWQEKRVIGQHFQDTMSDAKPRSF